MYKNLTSSTLFVFLVTLLELLGTMVLVYFVSFTFGATLIENFYETTLFSLLISVTCFMPIFIYCEHTKPVDLLYRLFIKNEFKNSFEVKLVNIAFGGVIGAWCGALVIPLDWDRWWQEWPISCCFGSMFGAMFSALYNFFILRSKIKLHL